MEQALDGMADIIPPVPTHDGLAALLVPGSSALGWWLLGLCLAGLLLAAFLLRRRLRARWHLWHAERALRSSRPAPEIASRIERGLRHHHHLNILHPGQAPYGMDTTAWRNLIDRLHAARFGQQTLETDELRALLKPCFTPSPLAGQALSGTALDRAANPKGGGQDSPASKGREEGGDVGKVRAHAPKPSPSPQPSPIKGEGANARRR